jgi:hypothetical protein
LATGTSIDWLLIGSRFSSREFGFLAPSLGARPGRSGTQIGDLVFRRLTRLGVATSLINAERRALTPVRIGVTVDAARVSRGR